MESLKTLYAEIASRKETPKAGSYTNYLFTKGLDKILKKVGEEATEVVIAAKNNDQAELIAESADLLYHLSVLWVEQGVSLEDLAHELNQRQGKVSKTQDRQTIMEY